MTKKNWVDETLQLFNEIKDLAKIDWIDWKLFKIKWQARKKFKESLKTFGEPKQLYKTIGGNLRHFISKKVRYTSDGDMPSHIVISIELVEHGTISPSNPTIKLQPEISTTINFDTIGTKF